MPDSQSSGGNTSSGSALATLIPATWALGRLFIGGFMAIVGIGAAGGIVAAIAAVVSYLFGNYIVALLAALLLAAGGIVLRWTGAIFNFFIDHFIVGYSATLNTLGIMNGINIVWTGFRDLANIALIGLFVFLAINIILGVKEFGEKRMIAKVLTIAVLLNFSLLFSKMIIDATNFTAYQFYKSAGLQRSADGTVTSGGVADAFIAAAGITTIGDTFEGVKALADKSTPAALAFTIVATLLLFSMVALFLYGSFHMVTRGILLVFVMVVSPLAFVSWLVPSNSIGARWKEWWETLISAAFFAPMFMIALWASMLLLQRASQARGNMTLGEFFTNPTVNAGAWTLVAVYCFAVGFLFASIKFATSFSSSISGWKGTAALSRTVGSTALSMGAGVAGAGLRLGLGAAGRRLAQSQFVRNTPVNTLGGRLMRGALYGAATKSWDARNIPGVGAGAKALGLDLGKAGGKGGFLKEAADRKKSVDTRAAAIASFVGTETPAERKERQKKEADEKASEVRQEGHEANLKTKEQEHKTKVDEHESSAKPAIQLEENMLQRQKKAEKEMVEQVTRAAASADKIDPITGRNVDELKSAITGIRSAISEQTAKITRVKDNFDTELKRKLGKLPDEIKEVKQKITEEVELQKGIKTELANTPAKQRGREYAQGIAETRYFAFLGDKTQAKEVSKKVQAGLGKTDEQKDIEKLRKVLADATTKDGGDTKPETPAPKKDGA